MPWVKGSEKARAKYVTAKEIQEQFSLSKAQVYKLLQRPELQETIVKFGDKKAVRVNLDRFFEITQQLYR